MAHRNTIFSQLLDYIPRHEFESLARGYHKGQKLRQTSRWDQMVAISLGHLAKRQSLRDLTANLQAQQTNLYHLGSKGISRSTLARLNGQQPYQLYEALFAKLYQRCRSISPGHGFRFKNKMYSIDSSFINLSFKIFPWAKYHRVKAAVKLHVGLDHAGSIPAFAQITDARQHDILWGRTLHFSKGSMVVCDKGYLSYDWFQSLTDRGIFFVTRLRRKTKYKILQRHVVSKENGVRTDQIIKMVTYNTKKLDPPALRRISYQDPETGKYFEFLTNHFDLSAQTITAIYKERWKIETFFKWIKQNLQIKSFLGTTPNAVMTQIWIALCINLLLHYIKYISKTRIALNKMLRLFQLNLFMKRSLQDLIRQSLLDHIPKILPCQGVLL